MKHLFYNSLASLLLTVMLCLVVSGGQLENRAAPASPPAIKTKRPPFNGSIFGKRSGESAGSATANWLRRVSNSGFTLARPDGAPFEQPAPQLDNFRPTPVENLAALVLQMEPSIRAARRQCSELALGLGPLNSVEQSLTDAICAQLLASAGSGYNQRRQVA